MSEEQPKNPLHGITLENIVTRLVEHYGWGELGIHVRIRCFNADPSIKSSLKFLRKTPWARTKVENLYLDMLHEKKQEQESPWAFSKKT
ncbi:MAG: VF530 family protein [Mariprofundus sp.]